MAELENSDALSGNGSSDGQDSRPVDFYEAEVARYAAVVDEDLDRSFKRYGFTLFHSLPAGKQVEVAKKVGLMKGDAIDNYNLASLEIERGELGKAIDLLKKSLQQDAQLADAEHNIALCYEQQGKKNDAVAHWNKYLALVEDEDEKLAVQEHLNTLTAPAS